LVGKGVRDIGMKNEPSRFIAVVGGFSGMEEPGKERIYGFSMLGLQELHTNTPKVI
jgi:hypothetical protein